MPKALVSKVKTTKDIKKDIDKAVKLIGGWKKFIKKGDVVLLKPNGVYPAPNPATTARDFLKATIELVKEAGAKKIIVGESSVSYLNTRDTLQKLGYDKVCAETGAELQVFDEYPFVRKDINGEHYKYTDIAKILYNVDKVILLPAVKTHYLARYTISMKLNIGFTHKRWRQRHFWKLEPKIAELNTIIPFDLIIADARKIFITGGPGDGEVARPNLILAGTDRIAIDVEGVKIIQGYKAKNKLDMPVWELPTIKHAIKIGLDKVRGEEDYKVVVG